MKLLFMPFPRLPHFTTTTRIISYSILYSLLRILEQISLVILQQEYLAEYFCWNRMWRKRATFSIKCVLSSYQLIGSSNHKYSILFQVPVNLLRASRVFVFEPPPGIKANLLRTFAAVPAARMCRVSALVEWSYHLFISIKPCVHGQFLCDNFYLLV